MGTQLRSLHPVVLVSRAESPGSALCAPCKGAPQAERALSGRVIPVPWSGQWLLRREALR